MKDKMPGLPEIERSNSGSYEAIIGFVKVLECTLRSRGKEVVTPSIITVEYIAYLFDELTLEEVDSIALFIADCFQSNQ